VNYSETTPGIASVPQYDGKISSIQWRNKIEATKIAGVVGGGQGFGLGYDALNRLSASTYYQLSGTTWAASATDAFGESVPRYDEMGNIDSLVRKDKNGAALNRLGYRYLNKGNRLGGVMDGGSEGFTSSYSYDGNGNILADSKKGITMTYNYLDLIDTVKQGTSRLVFTYDAQGTKLYKQLLVSGQIVSQRHYVEDAEVTASDAVTHDGKIEFVTTPVGRLVGLGNRKYSEEYFLQDHLGNNRVTFRVDSLGASGISFVQNYYPFGRDMGDGTINYTASPASLYKYSDKEFQPELSLNTYDFGARHYDPRIGRWLGIDALAEDYLNVSGYTYVMNDPIGLYDPDGMQLLNPTNFVGAPVTTGGAAAPGVLAGAGYGVLSLGNAVLPYLLNNTAPDKITNYSGYHAPPSAVQPSITAAAASSLFYAVPVTGPAAESGYYLQKGDYINSIVSESYALIDLFSFGSGTAVRSSLIRTTEFLERNLSTTLEKEAIQTGFQYTKSNLKLGNEMHLKFHAGEHGKEFRLPSGRRIDFLDMTNHYYS